MNDISEMIASALLDHHATVCVPHTRRPPEIDQCVITYGDLCTKAGVPGLVQGVGRYLQEIAEWCVDSGWPPINSLAVNSESRMPGDSYDEAPECNLMTWPDEAANCISFAGYPPRV